MNRLRGRTGRETARAVSAMLKMHGVPAYQPFWKGYRDASRELGLMIRTNGLPLALALAIGRAGIASETFKARKPAEEKSGRAWAVIDLGTRLKKKAIEKPEILVELVTETTTAARTEYDDMRETALSVLLWQKALSAARVLPEEKGFDQVGDRPAEQEAGTP